MTPYRVALYWTPPDASPLAEFAARWLGRDTLGRWVPPLRLGFDPAAWDAMTEAPRRYGFHATLKAPFRLAGSASLEAVERAAEDLARTLAPSPLSLTVDALGSFLALRPVDPPATLTALAGRCVETLDRFRAPLTEAEIAKRGPNLSPRQRDYLRRWGYPYVFEDFRLHLTLTGALAEPERTETLARLRAAITPLLPPTLPLADLCLFIEPQAGEPLVLYRRIALG